MGFEKVENVKNDFFSIITSCKMITVKGDVIVDLQGHKSYTIC